MAPKNEDQHLISKCAASYRHRRHSELENPISLMALAIAQPYQSEQNTRTTPRDDRVPLQCLMYVDNRRYCWLNKHRQKWHTLLFQQTHIRPSGNFAQAVNFSVSACHIRWQIGGVFVLKTILFVYCLVRRAVFGRIHCSRFRSDDGFVLIDFG